MVNLPCPPGIGQGIPAIEGRGFSKSRPIDCNGRKTAGQTTYGIFTIPVICGAAVIR